MEKTKAGLFLDALSENAEIQAYLQGYALPEGVDKDDALLDIAKHFGYEITKEELAGEAAQRRETLDTARQTAEKEVEELSADDLDKVAGGSGIGVANCLGTPKTVEFNEGDYPDCKYTYKDKENCWLNDACDCAIYMYEDYNCNSTQKMASWDGSEIVCKSNFER